MAIRGSVILSTSAFLDDVRRLSPKYPNLAGALADLALNLLLDYDIREIRSGSSDTSVRVALVRHEDGQSRPLAIMFRATQPKPSPCDPYRTIVLLALVDAASLSTDEVA